MLRVIGSEATVTRKAVVKLLTLAGVVRPQEKPDVARSIVTPSSTSSERACCGRETGCL